MTQLEINKPDPGEHLGTPHEQQDQEPCSKLKKEAEKISQDEQGLLPEELVEVPTFLNTACCDAELIEEARSLLRERYAKNPDCFYKSDVDLILSDDWTMSRFLLRCRQDPRRSVDLVESAAKFRKQFKMGEAKPCDFPAEIYQVGGIFQYEPDRVGNVTMWMRAKFHRRCNELSHLMKQFILCTMEQCDKMCGGRGVSVVFDLTDCGLKNADPNLLFWLLNSFRNYCPKGLSYIIVYNLPWVLNATCSLALSWLSSTNRKRLRFIQGDQITKFIAPENLPDFVQGGLCKSDYRRVPENCQPASVRPHQSLVPISESMVKRLQELHERFTSQESS